MHKIAPLIKAPLVRHPQQVWHPGICIQHTKHTFRCPVASLGAQPQKASHKDRATHPSQHRLCQQLSPQEIWRSHGLPILQNKMSLPKACPADFFIVFNGLQMVKVTKGFVLISVWSERRTLCFVRNPRKSLKKPTPIKAPGWGHLFFLLGCKLHSPSARQ